MLSDLLIYTGVTLLSVTHVQSECCTPAGLAEQTVLVALGHATVMTPPGGDTENDIKSKKNS